MTALFPLCQPTEQASYSQRNRLASSKAPRNLCNLRGMRKLVHIFLRCFSTQQVMFKMKGFVLFFFSLQKLLGNTSLTMWKQEDSIKKKKKSKTNLFRFVIFKLIWDLRKKFVTIFSVWQEKIDTDKMSVLDISRQHTTTQGENIWCETQNAFLVSYGIFL